MAIKQTTVKLDEDKWKLLKNRGYKLQEIIDDAFDNLLDLDEQQPSELVHEREDLKIQIAVIEEKIPSLEKDYDKQIKDQEKELAHKTKKYEKQIKTLEKEIEEISAKLDKRTKEFTDNIDILKSEKKAAISKQQKKLDKATSKLKELEKILSK